MQTYLKGYPAQITKFEPILLPHPLGLAQRCLAAKCRKTKRKTASPAGAILQQLALCLQGINLEDYIHYH